HQQCGGCGGLSAQCLKGETRQKRDADHAQRLWRALVSRETVAKAGEIMPAGEAVAILRSGVLRQNWTRFAGGYDLHALAERLEQSIRAARTRRTSRRSAPRSCRRRPRSRC